MRPATFLPFLHGRPRPILAAVALSTALHLALAAPFSLTFLADDYAWMASAREPGGLEAAGFGAYWARVPVWTLMSWLMFRSRLWETSWLPMHVFFVVHATAAALLLRWWLRQADVEIRPASFALLATLVSFQPNVYEVLYWPTDMPYVVGALFLALALHARKPIPQGIGLSLSFLTLETFVLPALAFLGAGLLLRRDGPRPTPLLGGIPPRPALSGWLWGVGIWLGARLVLSRVVGSYPYAVSWNPHEVAAHMVRELSGLFLIHFYKVNWVLSLIQCFVVGGVALGCVRRKHIEGRALALILLLTYGSTAAYWPLAYGGSRVLYGSTLQLAVGTAWLLAVLSTDSGAARLARGALGLLGAVALTQKTMIFSAKHHNAAVLAAREASLARELRDCADPCTLEVKALGAGLKRDWVLPPRYWEPYVRWVIARHAPGKVVTVRIATDRPATAPGGYHAAPIRPGRLHPPRPRRRSRPGGRGARNFLAPRAVPVRGPPQAGIQGRARAPSQQALGP